MIGGGFCWRNYKIYDPDGRCSDHLRRGAGTLDVGSPCWGLTTLLSLVGDILAGQDPARCPPIAAGVRGRWDLRSSSYGYLGCQ